jgi:telomerase reverse transcriptase
MFPQHPPATHSYLQKEREYLLGASVLGNDQIYVQLKEFKERLLRVNDDLYVSSLNFSLALNLMQSDRPKLYFVKVDVQACFDTIEQTKLLEIIRELLFEVCTFCFSSTQRLIIHPRQDGYTIHQYAQVQYVNGQPKRVYRQRRAVPHRQLTSDTPHFTKLASDLAADLWNTIIVNQPLYRPSASREKIVQLLEEHITQNMVKIGGHYYRQRVGIPQGSVLSTMLCSFFYGDLERRDERLLGLRSDPGSVSQLFFCDGYASQLRIAAHAPGGRLPFHHDECAQGVALLGRHE